jgi:uncharacterized protein (TIGR00288 family)
VRTTLSRRFDIDAVLEAIKERGEVVTKVAYGNWKRADEYSQAMTEHAVQMVQRNVTPRGDKNGADINLALDALEMAFTRDHINAFVIVGGDSDFIALVEKLKQYDKSVFIVGGRAFTSIILQKNCHEFIAYENLIGTTAPSRRTTGRTQTGSRATLEDALPLVRRALKILADREVSPQMGLLKSTLLQLDSTFSEKDYGTGSFREFMEKMAGAGYLNLRQVDRSVLVEIRDSEAQAQPSAPAPEVAAEPAPAPEPAPAARVDSRELLSLFRNARAKARWPMYLRSMRQYLRAVEPGFEERALGFSTIHDLVRQGQREGIFRVERNRHGILRIFPGDRFPAEGQQPLPEEFRAEAEAAAAGTETAAPPVEDSALSPDLQSEPPASEVGLPEQEPVDEAAAGEAEPVPEPPQVGGKPKRKRRAAAGSPARKSTTSRRPASRKKADVEK